MKKLIYLTLSLMAGCSAAMAQTIQRPDVCQYCVMDTTGGYISIFDTVKKNPICNYELLTKEHLVIVHQIKIDRSKISFFPSAVNKLYAGSGDSRGHVIPFEDLAWSPESAKASMNLLRNLAPEPQPQNIGTELASENYERLLADSLGYVKVYAGTCGSLGNVKGINKPSEYWKLIVEPDGTKHLFIMPTTGASDTIGYSALNGCEADPLELSDKIGFDPEQVIK